MGSKFDSSVSGCQDRTSKEQQRKIWSALILVVLGVYVHLILTSEDGPVVEISEGKLQGKIATSRDGREYFQFLSIPYAKPPLGALRFESPVPPDAWEGIRRAEYRSPECLGTEILTTGRTVGQEDCLYLNVYTPLKPEGRLANESKHLLPVIAYIHGGAFVMGSTRIYGAKYFMDEDIVLVTMNYRLGALGFLNTGDGVVRGNMGLKDQTMALRWIQRNIASFGGDPNKVTIVGESAGGASTHLHMMSPMSKGLFHRAVSMSGTAAHLDWALDRNHSETAIELGKKVGCPVGVPTVELVRCLKSVSEADIGRSQRDNIDLWAHLKHFYAPSIEPIADSKAFLTESPMELLKSGRFDPVPWMEGLYEYEGLIYVLRFLHNGVDPMLLKDRKFRNENFAHILYQYDIDDEQIWDEIYQFYFNSSTTLSYDEMIVSLANLMSDRFFVKGAHEAAMIHAEKSPVYLYYMTYMGRTNIFSLLSDISHKSWIPFELQMVTYFIRLFSSWIFGTFEGAYGASHGDDVLLLFNGNDGVTGITRYCHDYKFSKDLVRVLVDFAYGENALRFNGEVWHPTPAAPSGLKFMKLDKVPSMISDPFSERMKFFNTLPF